MNITQAYHKMCDEVKNTKDKVVDTYNNTNMNPFPKNVNVTIKLDIAGTYGEAIDALDKLSPKRIQQIVGIFKKHQKTITKLIESELK